MISFFAKFLRFGFDVNRLNISGLQNFLFIHNH